MRGDPYWLSVNRDCVCKGCGESIEPKNRALFFPIERDLYGAKCCADEAARKFLLELPTEDGE